MWPEYDYDLLFGWPVVVFAESWPQDRIDNFVKFIINKENKMAKKDKNVMYRQGDVLLIRVDEHPAEATRLSNVTVAYGEATGHHHTFERGATLMELDEQVWVVATEPAPLAHQEHETILVEPGIYRVQIQREYEPEVGSQRVLD